MFGLWGANVFYNTFVAKALPWIPRGAPSAPQTP